MEERGLDVAKDIYNLDETILDMTGGKVKIITPTSKKKVSKLSGLYGEKGEHVTLLTTICSDGSSLNPLFIFSGKRMSVELVKAVHASFPDAEVAVSPKRWIDNGIFLETSEHFIHNLPPISERGYKLVIYDGHESHIQPEVASLAMQSKVEILTHPPHTSHVLQPLDKRVFGPFKAALKREIDSILDLGICKVDIPKLCRAAMDQSFTTTNITAAFAAAGISPIHGIDAIPTTMFQPNTGVRAQAGQIGCQIGAHQEMKQFIDEAINSEKDKRRHEHLPPLIPLEDARLRVKLMEMYFIGTVATLAVRPTQVASSSPLSAGDNSGGTSEDEETSDQEDEEEEAIDVSFLRKECGSQRLTTTQWLELHTEAVQKKLIKQQKTEKAAKRLESHRVAEERA